MESQNYKVSILDIYFNFSLNLIVYSCKINHLGFRIPVVETVMTVFAFYSTRWKGTANSERELIIYLTQ
jgi:hypothetical membrane protein